MTARSPQRQQLMSQLDPVVSAHGYDLEDVSVTAAGRRSLIRVIVDGDGGIDLDGVAEVSRAISEALDAGADAFAGPYVLEVSSPGVDRPLSLPRHWRRAVGRLVSVPTGPEQTQVTGRVVSADDDALLLSVDGSQRRIPFAELGNGRVQVEFSRPGASDADGPDDDSSDDDSSDDDSSDDDSFDDDSSDDDSFDDDSSDDDSSDDDSFDHDGVGPDPHSSAERQA